jgi:hypothetical protein
MVAYRKELGDMATTPFLMGKIVGVVVHKKQLSVRAWIPSRADYYKSIHQPVLSKIRWRHDTEALKLPPVTIPQYRVLAVFALTSTGLIPAVSREEITFKLQPDYETDEDEECDEGYGVVDMDSDAYDVAAPSPPQLAPPDPVVSAPPDPVVPAQPADPVVGDQVAYTYDRVAGEADEVFRVGEVMEAADDVAKLWYYTSAYRRGSKTLASTKWRRWAGGGDKIVSVRKNRLVTTFKLTPSGLIPFRARNVILGRDL